jgi:hypothetical protein
LNLVVRVRSFFSLPDGRPKTWMQGKILPTQTVDPQNYDILQLVDFIAEHYNWDLSGGETWTDPQGGYPNGCRLIDGDQDLRA